MGKGLPGSLVLKTLCFHCRGSQVPCLVRELRSRMPLVAAKKKKKKSKAFDKRFTKH